MNSIDFRLRESAKIISRSVCGSKSILDIGSNCGALEYYLIEAGIKGPYSSLDQLFDDAHMQEVKP